MKMWVAGYIHVNAYCKNFNIIILQVFPGLMVTSAALHRFLNLLNITVHIRDVCVFLAPMFRYLEYIIVIKTTNISFGFHLI